MANGLNMWLAVASGGAVGACLRFGVYRLFGAASGFPWATLTVNVVGSAIMGGFISWLAVTLPHSQELRAFVTVGLLGAFTTFSTFALDVYVLYERKAYMMAVGYGTASVVLSIAAFLAGLSFVKAVMS